MAFVFSRRLVAGLSVSLVALASLAGCAAEPTKSKESIDSYESELRLSGTRYLGKIASGESETVSYTGSPAYRSYGFEAKGGDEITVDVASEDGDAMAWITNSNYNVFASNDDASDETFDSKAVYTVPAGTASRSYRLVFREYDRANATFTVSLNIKAAAPLTCTYDGKTYTAGDSFASTDGCNTCGCGTDGGAVCTKKACVCNPANEPKRNYLGTPATCSTIRYTCKTGTRSFQNACGCGCETL